MRKTVLIAFADAAPEASSIRTAAGGETGMIVFEDGRGAVC